MHLFDNYFHNYITRVLCLLSFLLCVCVCVWVYVYVCISRLSHSVLIYGVASKLNGM